MELTRSKAGDTKQGPGPAAPPRSEGVVPWGKARSDSGGSYGRGCVGIHFVRFGEGAISHVAARNEQQMHQHQHEADRKSTRLNSSHSQISYAVFCLKKKKNKYSTKPVEPPCDFLTDTRRARTTIP